MEGGRYLRKKTRVKFDEQERKNSENLGEQSNFQFIEATTILYRTKSRQFSNHILKLLSFLQIALFFKLLQI